jgi:threonine aldolase
MNFVSDNAVGASRPILDAIVASSDGAQPAYAQDDYTKKAETALNAFFEREVSAFLVATGTAANALALSAICPPWGAIFCHEHAHVHDDECGAPEMMTDGAKLVGLAGEAGKLTPRALADEMARFPRGLVKQVQPAAVSLSQATECGAAYTPAQIAALAQVAHAAGAKVHMDGARFVNALLGLGCSPAEMTWRAGVDVLSLGATKNGALACEAVVFFDPALAADFAFRRKRSGHLVSKSRFLGAQMAAWLENDHWRALGLRANAAARRLREGLLDLTSARAPWPTEANEVFVVLPRAADLALKAAGARYHDWGARSLPPGQAPNRDEVFVRLVCSFATTDAQIDRFVEIVRAAGE